MKKFFSITIMVAIAFLMLTGAAREDKKDLKKDKNIIDSNVNYKVDVELRLIDVIVLNSDGEHVTDLGPEDFEVYEDGELQKLVAFDNLSYKVRRPGAVDVEDMKDAAQKIAEEEERKKLDRQKVKSELGKKLPPPPQGTTGRSIVILFDNFNTYQTHLQKAKKAAKDFIMNDVLPEDRVAVIKFYGSAKVIQDFTDDKLKLLSSVTSIKQSMGDPVGKPEIADESIEMYGGADTGTTTIENLRGDGSGYYSKPWLGKGQFSNRDRRNTDYQPYATDRYWDPGEKYYNVRNFLSVLRSMGKTLNTIPGRKTIIFLSPGFLGVNPVNQPWAYVHMGNTLEKLSGYNITMYSVDVSGVATDPTGKREERWDFLTYVSEKTGGKLFKNNNNLLKQLQRVNYEISRFYLLGYKSKNVYDDGRFIDIDVKCKRPGTTVRTVRGLYSVRSWDKKTLDERKSELTRELNIGKTQIALPIKYDKVSAIPSPDGKIVYPLTLKFPIYHDFEKYELLSYDVLMRVRDDMNETVQDYFEEIRVGKETIIGSEFIINFPLLLASGKYTVEVAVKNNITDMMGTHFHQITIPEKIKGFSVTEPQLFTSFKGATLLYPKSSGRILREEYYPHVGKKLMPVAGRKLYLNEETVLYLGMVNFGMDYTGEKADVDIDFVLRRFGKVVKVPFDVYRFLDGEKKDVLTVLLRIPPNELEPGRYSLEIYCKDNATNKIMRKNLSVLFTTRKVNRFEQAEEKIKE